MTKIIRYNEIFTLSRGILNYSTFQIEGYDKAQINYLCLSTFGSFILSPNVLMFVDETKSISDDNLNFLGKLIDTKFSPNWLKYAITLSVPYEILNTYSISEIETVEGTNITNDESSTQENRDIYAYNSVDSVNDSKNDSTMTGNRQNQINNRREKTTSGNNGTTTPQNRMIAELEFRRKSLVDYILRDIKQFATLAIV